ncbi:protein containing DUF1329 [Candidatus Magnetomorum sp. HK-1]|nr:protein containing DUF1329 [Candidatus Magnetomorum sp. HK-1]
MILKNIILQVKLINICLVITFIFFPFDNVDSKVSAKLSKQLGKTGTVLTPTGALRAGNYEGTIPEWTGGITIKPSGYKPGDFHPFPFKQDQRLFTINIKNYEQYKNKLTPGLIELIKVYPKTFQMNIYPTHRTASFPEWVYQALIENASNAELIDNGNGVRGARVSSPFPIPKNGVEAIWNHLLYYRGTNIIRYGAQCPIMENGSYTIINIVEKLYGIYTNPLLSVQEIEKQNLIMYFMQYITSPPRMAGNALLVYEHLNQIKQQRKAWIYNQGQRRVRRTPNIAYSYPGTASDGLRTTDDWDAYNGSPNRYKWKLLGKKEIYIPYNCYKLHSNKIKYSQIIQPGHINQDLVRYELHRVWVVEANLIKTYRHVYNKRVFYLDEDSWFCLAAEMYDSRDQLYRVLLTHVINYYDLPTIWTTLDIYHDFYSKRYLASQIDNEERMVDFKAKLTKKNFSIDALRRIGIR